MARFWELIGVIGETEDVIFGDFDRYVVMKELENEKDRLTEEGYSQVLVQARVVEKMTQEPVELKTLKQGQIFKRKLESTKAYERSEYDREFKRYSCVDLDDISRALYLKGTTKVYPW